MDNSTTFTQFDFSCLKLAKLTDQDLNPSLRQRIINNMSYKIYGLLDGVNDPFWDKVVTLTVSADQETLKDTATSGGILTALDASAHTITRSTGTFPAGAVLDIVMVTKAAGLLVAQYKAIVTVAGATGTYAVVGSVNGAETTFAGATHTLFVNVMKSFSATSADLSTLYVQKFRMIYDNAGASGSQRVFDLYTDSRAYGEAQRDPDNAKRIVCLHYGNTVAFKVGSSAIALGTVQALVKGKPVLFTDSNPNDPLSSAPEENQMLTDEVTAEYIRSKGGDVPKQLQEMLAMYQKRYEAAAADRAKAAEGRGERSA